MPTPDPLSLLLQPCAHLWDWQMRATCRSVDTTLFFGRDGESRGERQRRERLAKSVCELCPVRWDCLSHALTVGERYGIWGGTSETERRHWRDLGRRRLLPLSSHAEVADETRPVSRRSRCLKDRRRMDLGADPLSMTSAVYTSLRHERTSSTRR